MQRLNNRTLHKLTCQKGTLHRPRLFEGVSLVEKPYFPIYTCLYIYIHMYIYIYTCSSKSVKSPVHPVSTLTSRQQPFHPGLLMSVDCANYKAIRASNWLKDVDACRGHIRVVHNIGIIKVYSSSSVSNLISPFLVPISMSFSAVFSSCLSIVTQKTYVLFQNPKP